VLGEVTWKKDRYSENLTSLRNISAKCNKQVTSKQQTRFSLTSINLSSKTTVVFGMAMTILEIGIYFPTLVYRREKTLHNSIAREFCSEGHRDRTKQEKSLYHRRLIVSLAGKHQEKTDRNVSTC
jgi:hypothetical protein